MILDRAVDGGDSVVVGKTTGTSGVVWREGRADELSRDPRIPWDCAGGDGNGGRRDGLAVLMLPGFSTACTGSTDVVFTRSASFGPYSRCLSPASSTFSSRITLEAPAHAGLAPREPSLSSFSAAQTDVGEGVVSQTRSSFLLRVLVVSPSRYPPVVGAPAASRPRLQLFQACSPSRRLVVPSSGSSMAPAHPSLDNDLEDHNAAFSASPSTTSASRKPTAGKTKARKSKPSPYGDRHLISRHSSW